MGPRYGLLVGLIPASITFSISGGMAMGKIRPTYLRCEYRVNPMGIDSTEPRLSWLLESIGQEERGQIQSAYRILVASSRRMWRRISGISGIRGRWNRTGPPK
jgi:hypothetical protein